MRKTGFLLALSLIFSLAAHASLGDRVDAVDAQGQPSTWRPQGQRTTQNFSSYTVEETTTHAAKIREYLTLDGVFFAIAWTGRVHPNLSHLLGKHFHEYQTAEADQPRKPGQRSHRRVTAGSGVVVEHGGHMRNLQGRVYDPALIPAGVSLDEIR